MKQQLSVLQFNGKRNNRNHCPEHGSASQGKSKKGRSREQTQQYSWVRLRVTQLGGLRVVGGCVRE